jgi:phosphatidylserine/phosphatidylglycerophosphate/cardiolipin synthase-like enzyme
MSDRLALSISRLTRVLTVEELEHVHTALGTGQLAPSSSRRTVERLVGRRPVAVEAVCAFQYEWQSTGLSPEALVLAIRSASAVRTEVQAEATTPELVWTGPRPLGSVVRATSEVMKEMIGGARQSIILLGYAITTTSDLPSSASTVLGLLAEARRHLTDVTVVLNNTAENRKALVDAWPAGVALPRILTWVGDPAKPYASLHAKVLIADQCDLLITSANLTHHGLDANLELGVRLRGGFVQGVVKHLLLLEREGHLFEQVP